MTIVLTPQEYEDIKARPSKVYEDVVALEATIDALARFARAALPDWHHRTHSEDIEYKAARKVLADAGWLT